MSTVLAKETDPVKLMLVRSGETHARTLEIRTPDSQGVTPAALRRQVGQLTGMDVILLHDGGLSLGVHGGPVLLESLQDWTSLPGWQGEQACVPPNARPWQHPGWFTEVLCWVDAVLLERGEKRSGAVEQVSTCDFACVLRSGTEAGEVYFKAVYQGREASITRVVADSWPSGIPELLATDPGRGWMLTRTGGHRLHEEADPQAWIQAVGALARAHALLDPQALMDEAGPVIPLEELAQRAEVFFAEVVALRHFGLGDEQISGLTRILPRLAAAQGRLAALRLNEVFCHGDAHPMNALYGGRGTVWFDWNEAFVGHPLLDIGWFLAWLRHPARQNLPIRQACPEIGPELWQSYLKHAGIERAQPLMGDAVALALLLRALRFHEHMRHVTVTVPGWRPQGVPYFLRWLLREMS